MTCRSGHAFPIIGGIPRLLPPQLLDYVLKKYHSSFLKEHHRSLDREMEHDKTGNETIELKIKTLKSFGYEWQSFSDIHEEYESQFLSWIKPLSPQFFQGRTTLDAGCGMGRHVLLATKYGSEVVGFDLSEAVEAAYKNTRHLSNAHIVQADIYNPPFSQRFDFVYSIGVLHHLPDSEKAFQTLYSLLKPRGHLFVWVYGEEGNFLSTHLLEVLRKSSTRLPLRLLHILSFPLGIFLHLATKMYEVIDRFPAFRGLAERLPSRDYFLQIANYDIEIKCSIVFDLLSAPIAKYFTKEEIEQWFRNSGLENVEVTWRNRNSWRGIGRKP